jgi:hypothetical protein
VKPPSSLRVELPISIGPSIGPDPWKSVYWVLLVTFHPNVPAISIRLPSVAMVSLFFARKELKTSVSVAVCSRFMRRRRCHFGRLVMKDLRVEYCFGGNGFSSAVLGGFGRSRMGLLHLLSYRR